jgi:phosphatidylinositol-3-phosphatase
MGENAGVLARPHQVLSIAARALAVLAVAAACSGPGATASPTPTSVPAASATASVAASATIFATIAPGTSASPTVGPSPTSVSSPTPAQSPSSGSSLPNFRHVYVIILENKSYGSIVGAGNAPYLNSLIARYGLVTNLDAETHPSEPNYIALTSGGLQGTDSDGTYNLNAPNLFDQIDASGRTWRVYAQGYPGGCYKSFQAGAVADGPGAVGDYVRKHNPAMSYTSISRNAARCAQITHLTGFDPAAADFEMIIPNEINDMHSSSTRAGDDFLRDFVPQITGSPAFANSLLVITWDEGAGSDTKGGGGHIATILASPGMTPGSRFTDAATHYSILRTIELAWGMPLLGAAATAPTITLHY